MIRSIALARLNADTIQDIAVGPATATGLAIRIWLAGGGGSFGSPTMLAHEGNMSMVCAGDIDGDGDADLAAACWPLSDTFRSVAVFKNQGAATFTGPTYYAGLQGASDAVLVDMDQDGWLDIVASTGDPNFSSNLVAVLRNDGQGGFESGKVALALDDFDVHTIADFNRDGKPDVAVGVADGVAVGLGNGDGTFALTGETLGLSGPAGSSPGT